MVTSIHRPLPRAYRSVSRRGAVQIKLTAVLVVLMGCVTLLRSQRLVQDDPDVLVRSLRLVLRGSTRPQPSGDSVEPTPVTTWEDQRSGKFLALAQETPLEQRDVCYYERGLGILERAAESANVFCPNTTVVVNASIQQQTSITLIESPGGIRAALLRNLVLDLTNAMTHRPITSLADDGGDHDPRFRFSPQLIYCACEAFRNISSSSVWNLWDVTFGYHIYNYEKDDPSLVCSGPNAMQLTNVIANSDEVVEIKGKVVLLPRRDDHNPFFQISGALNAWLMLHAQQWDPRDVTVIHLDMGYPSPIDKLHQKLLSPMHEIVNGPELQGKRLWFSGEVLLPPFETTGPMMQHLDDDEPCFASPLLHAFRSEALDVLGANEVVTRTDDVIVTIISRQAYKGRSVQRVWLNEPDILAQLQIEYTTLGNRTIIFQRIEFAELNLTTQMQLMLQSDIVIGMHGAGMVNVLWTRPGTLVIEIFPHRRKRWGYRNLCQFVGCEWHEFRGGQDVLRGWNVGDSNANDKIIPYDEWRAFFGPLLRNQITKITNSAVKDESVTP